MVDRPYRLPPSLHDQTRFALDWLYDIAAQAGHTGPSLLLEIGDSQIELRIGPADLRRLQSRQSQRPVKPKIVLHNQDFSVSQSTSPAPAPVAQTPPVVNLHDTNVAMPTLRVNRSARTDCRDMIMRILGEARRPMTRGQLQEALEVYGEYSKTTVGRELTSLLEENRIQRMPNGSGYCALG